jgi:hypothetical protein
MVIMILTLCFFEKPGGKHINAHTAQNLYCIHNISTTTHTTLIKLKRKATKSYLKKHKWLNPSVVVIHGGEQEATNLASLCSQLIILQTQVSHCIWCPGTSRKQFCMKPTTHKTYCKKVFVLTYYFNTSTDGKR